MLLIIVDFLQAKLLIPLLILGIQLCFRRIPIDGFSGKW